MHDAKPPSFWSLDQLEITVQRHGADPDVIQIAKPYALLGSHDKCDVIMETKDTPARSILFIATIRGLRAIVLAPNGKNAGRVVRIETPITVGNAKVDVRLISDKPANGKLAERTQLESDSSVSKSTASDAADSKHIDESLSEPGSAKNKPISLVTWQGEHTRHYAQLSNHRPVTIGRRSPSQLLLADDQLTGTHCCLVRTEDTLWVIDLATSNGTWLKKKSVSVAAIESGQSVRIGKHRLHFLRLPTQETVDDLTQSLNEANEQRTTLLADSNVLQSQLAAVSQSLETRDADACLAAELAAKQRCELQLAVDEAAAKQMQLSEALTAANEALTAANEAKEQLQAELSDAKQTAEQQLVASQENSEAAQQDQTRLQREVERLKAKIETATAEAKSQQSDFEQLVIKSTATEGELADLRTENELLQQRLNEQSTLLQTTTDAKAELESQAASLQEQLGESQQRGNQLQSERDEFAQRLDSLHAEISARVELEGQISELTSRQQQAEQTKADLESRLKSLQRAAVASHEALLDTQRERDTIAGQLDGLKHESTDRAEKLDQFLSLRNQHESEMIIELQARVQSLQVAADQMNELLQESQRDRDMMARRMSDMEADFAERQRILRDAEFESGKREVQLIAMKSEINRERAELALLRTTLMGDNADGNEKTEQTLISSPDFHSILDRAIASHQPRED